MSAPKLIAALIPNAGTTPVAGIRLRGYSLVGVFIPAGLEGTALTFTACETLGGTYVPVKKEDGSDYSVTVASSRYAVLDPTRFAGCPFVKPVIGTAQTGAITLTLACK